MTKASINKNTVTVLFAILGVSALSLGSFATTAFAQDDPNIGYGDLGGDTAWYDTGSGYSADTGLYDTGSGYTADTGYYDVGSSYTPDTGYSDVGSAYSPETGYSDVGSAYTPYVEENGVAYTEQQYGNETPSYTEQQYGYSTPSYSYSTPLAISAPSSYYPTSFSAPFIPSAPIIQNIPIAYQQQQQQQIITPQPNIVTNNTCTNYSCNTVTSISNSGNTTTTVIPVSQAPITYPVQYTYPQNYTYPTYYSNYQNVSCTITASPNSIAAGQYTYLSWQSYGATSATLTNYGNVAQSGSLSVQPYGSMNYVLTVYGYNGQSATCNTFVTVGNVYQSPSVTLSQIPYTGFDFGVAGDAMYYALLALFALAAGYLLVYYKGGMAAFAHSMSSGRAGAMMPARKMTPVRASTPMVETKAAPVVQTKTGIQSPIKVATLESLPAFASVRPTSDSMTIATHGGAPRIVINRD